MSDSQKIMMSGIRCVVGLAVFVAVVLNGLMIYWQGQWLLSEIQKSKCNCSPADRQQIHEQHVNVAPQWSREDTIREELKARRERQNDVRGIAGAEKPNGS